MPQRYQNPTNVTVKKSKIDPKNRFSYTIGQQNYCRTHQKTTEPSAVLYPQAPSFFPKTIHSYIPCCAGYLDSLTSSVFLFLSC